MQTPDEKILDHHGVGRMQNGETERKSDLARIKLGPNPDGALRAFVDLGLDDSDIGRYLGIPTPVVTSLRAAYRIAPSDKDQAWSSVPDGMNDDGYLVEIQRVGGDITKVRKAAFRRATPDSKLRRFATAMRSKLFSKD